MRSPFPGVDPYVEATHRWPDFHQSFITYLRDTLLDTLPEHYEVRIDERLSLTELMVEDVAVRRPDVTVIRTTHPAPHQQLSAPGAAVAEPVRLPTVISETFPEAYLKVLHRPDESVVTVIELLSPANKTDAGRGEYLVKRNALLKQPIHLVELDLLLGGQRLPMRRPLPVGDFYAIVARAEDRPDCEVYAWSIREAPPVIRVPLKAPDPDANLALGPLFAQTFDRGRYSRHIDYSTPLLLPLRTEDREWALERARGAPK
jgi:hypothetical protein